MTGGLAVAGVLATTVFAAICGSSVATAVALGVILVPAMIEQKYERPFAVGLVGASGTMGILIPPRSGFHCLCHDRRRVGPASVSRWSRSWDNASWLVYCLRGLVCKSSGLPKAPQISSKEAGSRTLKALPALLIPVVILGGIYSGIVTVTEAAGVAAFLSIVVSVMFYGGCKVRDILPLIGMSMRRTATIIAIIMTAVSFGHWMTSSGGPQQLADAISNANLKPWQFLIIINIFFLILGTFLEVMAIMLITLPIILPLLAPMGIDPIHFAVVMVINMELALITPPIGLNLFVLSSATSTPLSEVTKGVLPFMLLMLVLLILVTYIPAISLWLPTLVYG